MYIWCVYVSTEAGVVVSNSILYLIQGLFHPARKVREVYWKIYNMLYIGSQVKCLFVCLFVCLCLSVYV